MCIRDRTQTACTFCTDQLSVAHSPWLIFVRSAQNEISGTGVAVAIAGGAGVAVAAAGGAGVAVGGRTGVGVGGGGGGASITGTFSALVASTKSADAQPMPPGAAGNDTAHQRPSALRPTISPSSPLRATPITGNCLLYTSDAADE